MTPEQTKLFIRIAQMGVACGLMHPVEWLVNYVRCLGMFMAYAECPKAEEEARNAFIAFYRGTGACQDDPVEQLDANGLADLIQAYYDKP